MKNKSIIARGTCVDRAMFHWMYHNDRMSIWSIAELDAPLDPSLLKQAVKVLLRQIPILSAHYNKGLHLGYWQENLSVFNNDTWVERTISQKSCATDEQASEAISSVLTIPVSMESPPYLKITLITSPTHSYFVLQVHHVVTDGEGVKRIGCLLAENYRKALSNTLPDNPVPLNMNRSWRQFYMGVTKKEIFLSLVYHSKEMFRVIKFISSLKTSGSVFHGKQDMGKTDAPYYRTLTLPESFVETLKGTGTTVNDLLMTGLLLTLKDWNDRFNASFSSIGSIYTADMRKWWREPKGTFANMSVIRLLHVAEKDLSSPVKAYQTVKARINQAKKEFGYKEFWDFGVMSLFPNIIAPLLGKSINKMVKNIHGLTNIGIIPDEAGDFGNVQATSLSMLAPPLKAPCVVFTAGGFKNRVTIHGIFCETHLSKEYGSEIMVLYRQHLNQLLDEIESRKSLPQ